MEFNGRPLLWLTLEKFQASSAIDGIILIAPPGDVEFCEREIIKRYDLNKVERVIEGGERRQDSVRMGIESSGGRYDLILIHDGVRPFIEKALIERVVSAAEKDRAVITALPARETVKEIDEKNTVIKTLDRRRVWLVQTPQVFRYEDIMAAHEKALQEGWEEATDDALLIERMGIPVRVIEGSEHNIKITTPHDLDFVRYLLDKGTSCKA